MTLATAEELIAEIKQGRMVVVMDDENRENEGDLIMAASHIDAAAINFMSEYGRGLICLTLTQERADRLGLTPMVKRNKSQFSTNFTISIEAAQGVTTGISAHDRARTVQAAVNPNAHADDLVQPGHIFPIIAREGGVLSRAGHTEAGCDLARLAGLQPASVIVEILNDDGTMARRPDLERFAAHHGLKIGTVADLIEYRIRHETTIEKIGIRELHTEFGTFALHSFKNMLDGNIHYAIEKGETQTTEPTRVRVHAYDFLTDVLGAHRPEPTSWTLRKSLAKIAQENGIIVVLHPFAEQKPEHAQDQDRLRNLGLGAQILKALGVRDMHLLNSPGHYRALSGFGLEVVSFISDAA